MRRGGDEKSPPAAKAASARVAGRAAFFAPHTTVELIVAEQEWNPGVRFPPEKRVLIQVGFGETEPREAIKQAGGFWNPEKKAWMLAYRKVLELGLEKRLVDEIGL